MKVLELVSVLETYFPKSLQEGWDNSGLQISPEDDNIKGVLLCLDVGKASVREAYDRECNLIISHHPLIFRELKGIYRDSYPGSVICEAVKLGVGVYSMHTNMDKAEGGLNEFLCGVLGLSDVEVVEELSPLRIGRLPNVISLSEAVEYISEKLGVDVLKYVGDDELPVRTVAVCSGSGGSFIYSIPQGVDLFITGDLKHHEAFYAREMGIGVVDATHFYSEVIFKHLMKGKLSELCPEVRVVVSETDTIPWKYRGRGGGLE